MAEKVYTPVAPRASYFTDDPRANLAPSEEKMYSEVLAHFTKDGYTLPNVGEKGELTEKEKFWLSRECLLRYLRASKWKVSFAIQRIENTLKWRREYGLYDTLTPEYVEPEAVTGKEILFGYDVNGRPAFYMIPSRQNTEDPVRQNQFAVWMLERGVDTMEAGVETLDLLINFAQRAKHPHISQARQFLNIIQDHYPERLGLALVLNIPFLVHAFFKLITPFIDPVTREKIKFNPSVVEDGIFEKDMLMKEWWGGAHDFEYVHEQYWPEFVGKCEDNVAKWTARWKELGGTIGISEWAYKHNAGAEVVEEILEEVKPAPEVKQETPVVIPQPEPEHKTEEVKKEETEVKKEESEVKKEETEIKKEAAEVKEEPKKKDGEPTTQGPQGGGVHGEGAVTAGAVATSGGDAAGADGGGGGGD